jgi:diguanylate cyclase (GGDEF)-like protein
LNIQQDGNIMVLPRILFVDDEENILVSIQRPFRSEPFEILTATSAAKALDLLATEHIDVIVSDDKMPGMLGSELLAEVNRLYPEVCKIMLTGHGDFTSALRGINEARIFRFLLKPVSGQDLINIIHNAIQEHKRGDEVLALSQNAGKVCSYKVRFDQNLEPVSFLWSENTRSLLGLDDHESLDSWEILNKRLHDQDRESVISSFRSCLSGELCADIEFQVTLGQGSTRWLSQTTEISRDVQGRPQYLLSVLKDVTQERHYREWLEKQAFQDNLTGLGNRALLFKCLEEVLKEKKDVDGVALLFLDLDDFKLINDSLGHPLGDWLLQAFATRLQCAVPLGATAVRLGGDEFALIFPGPNAQRQAERSAMDIMRSLEEPFLFQDYELHVSASIGVAASPAADQPVEELLRDADTAMYVAKSRGKGGYQVFNKDMHNRAADRFRLLSDMRRGLTGHQFFPYYQPIVRLDNMKLDGYEALARWRHPEKGMIMPSEFIPAAEESGLISSLGMMIMDMACAQARKWGDAFSGVTPFMSVNVSCRQLRQPDLAKQVAEILDHHNLDPKLLKIEITESGIMEDVVHSLSILTALKKLGVRLQIDDFGTGYSSLSYLCRIPADAIKVDRSFVNGMENDTEKQSIVKTIIDLAHSLGMNVVSEGVETVEQLALLRSFGCQYGQGYLFDKPLSAEEAEKGRDYSRFIGCTRKK